MNQFPAGGSAAGADDPFVSVIVLNYNAGRFLPDCLRSLLATDYPRGAFEIVVVDNASTDGSPALLAREFPEVRLVHAGANLGFAAGNNLALRQAPGPYMALVNPDTAVAPGWLRPLVQTLEGDPDAGAAQPKLLLYEDRIPLVFESPVFVPRDTGLGSDRRTLGLRLYAVAAQSAGTALQVEYRSGCGGIELDETGRQFRWTLGRAELGVIAGGTGAIEVELELAAPHPHARSIDFAVTIGGEAVFAAGAGPRNERLRFEVPARLRRCAAPVVQNAGSAPLPDGSSRDRGTVVSWGNVFCDWDGAAYSRAQEVFSFCGAGVLLRKAMLEEAGCLDENLFMYYEDTDLAIRARRRGWRVLYQPASAIRHHHSALAREWSPFFNYHVGRSRLYVIVKNWPLDVAVRAVADHFVQTARSGARWLRGWLAGSADVGRERERFFPLVRALWWMSMNMGRALAARADERRAGSLDVELFRPWLAPQ